jgi:peptide/nickel transport system substrate-binding protein
MVWTRDDHHRDWFAYSASRREFVKRMAMIGASAPTIAAILAACDTETDDDVTAEEDDAGPVDEPDDDEDPVEEPDDDEPVDEPDDDEEDEVADNDIPRGGIVRHLLYEDPDTLNFVVGGTSIGRQVYAVLVEGLVYVDPDEQFQPLLAEEVPTEDNGGITNDGLTVTWKLKQGVTWHDGEPFTADDVVFTYEAAMSSDSIHQSKFEKIENIEAVDDHTVEINYSEIDVGYLECWHARTNIGIIPRHATGDIEQIENWDWNRSPIGTGPFQMVEWAAGDHVTVQRYEDYHESGKPYLDQIHFLVIPSEETRAQMMLRGDAEIMLWPGSTFEQEFEEAPNVSIELAPGVWNCRFFMNMSEPFNDDPGPDSPHPLLGDPEVRYAITMAINRHRIVDDILESDPMVTSSPWPVGWYAVDFEDYEYDKDQARQMLEEAGWVEGDDGVRVAQGALYADDGHRAEIGLSTYAGFLDMELIALAIQEDLGDIGIQVNVSIEDFAVIFGSWGDNAPRKTGDFDTMLYDTSVGGVEPHATIRNAWHSSAIPSEESPGGDNYTRFNEPDADEHIDAAGATLDLDARADHYRQMAEIEREIRPIVYIFQYNEGNAYSDRLHGYLVSTWEWSTWDAKDWYLEDS